MSSSSLWCYLLTLGALVALSSSSPLAEKARHQQELTEHYHHLQYLAEYTCHHPQPRTVPVHELLSPYQTRGKAYFPEYTVLHRCDVFSGCCEGVKKCGPVHAHSVHLPFKVTYLEDMGDKHMGEWEMQYINFDNHTICGCVDHSGLKKPHDHYSQDHDHKDHHKQDLDHKYHHSQEEHDHKDQHKHKEEDHKDHHGDEDRDHKRPQVYKDKYPTVSKDSVRKDSVKSEEESYAKPEKRPETKYDSKKIDTLYITI